MSSADPVRPTRGFQIGNTNLALDVVVPTSMAQCESFLVYFHITIRPKPWPRIMFYTPDLLGELLTLQLGPAGTAGPGYIDWTCNIPAGYSLILALADVRDTLRGHNYIIAPGPSFPCPVNQTDPRIVRYGTNFESYTSAMVVYQTTSIRSGCVSE